MGIFVDKLKFKLDGSNWLVRVGSRFSGLSYKVKIDDRLLIDERPKQSVDEMLSPQSFQITYRGKGYRLEIGPISMTKTGVHVYSGSELIYRHNEENFGRFNRTKKYIAWIDKIENKTQARDTRPLWKQWLEVLIIGLGGGAAYGAIRIASEEFGGPDIGNIGVWPAAIIAGLAVWFWPAKLRLIK